MRLFLNAALIGLVFLTEMASAQARRAMPRPGLKPGAIIERLNRMTPEERQRALDRLPPERRVRVQERLDRLNAMPPQARERLREQYDEFQKLPPERQETVRRAFRDLNQLPEDRRPALRREIVRLRNMPAERRAFRMESERFRSLYSESERQLIRDLSEAVAPVDTNR